MPELGTSISQLRPEFTEPSDTIDKTIVALEHSLLKERRLKIDAYFIDSPLNYNSGIYNSAAYNYDKYAGDSSPTLSNIITKEAQIIVPDKDFIEIFQSDYLISKFPKQYIKGSIDLEYNEVLESEDLYFYNDYSVSYTTQNKIINGITYYFSKPNITDNPIPLQKATLDVKGSITYVKGSNFSEYVDFTSTSMLLKYDYGLWNAGVYSGGSFQISGTHNNTLIVNGFLRNSDGSTGEFISDVLYNSPKDLENFKISVSEIFFSNSDKITYYISSDNGVTWQLVDKFDEYIEFTVKGKQLRIKIVIDGWAMLDTLQIQTSEVVVDSDINDSFVELYVGNDSEGWTKVLKGQETDISYNKLRYKIVNITPDSIATIRRVRLKYS